MEAQRPLRPLPRESSPPAPSGSTCPPPLILHWYIFKTLWLRDEIYSVGTRGSRTPCLAFEEKKWKHTMWLRRRMEWLSGTYEGMKRLVWNDFPERNPEPYTRLGARARAPGWKTKWRRPEGTKLTASRSVCSNCGTTTRFATARGCDLDPRDNPHANSGKNKGRGGPGPPGAQVGVGGGGPGAGAAGRARDRAPAGRKRPRGAPCRRGSASVCAPVRRGGALAAALLARCGGAPEPAGDAGSGGGDESRSCEAGRGARAHAHAAAGLGRLGARAGGGPRAGRVAAGAEGAPLPGAGRLPSAASPDRKQFAAAGRGKGLGDRLLLAATEPTASPCLPGPRNLSPHSATRMPAATFLEKDYTCAYSRFGGEIYNTLKELVYINDLLTQDFFCRSMGLS
ncbi:collagen alpha-1(I) chain-like [Neofelis nebulosa]|uniref:collagen alpha-1(I) chain-like n=1 Tax=Neofelis nebulosa TaxID=61452 RepID=UPI00272C54F1|nr:collagen alpha-1(I) chain-like [Neofelis nebulosa]